MQVSIGKNKTALVLTNDECDLLTAAAKGTTLTPHGLAELLAEVYSSNLRQDVGDLRTFYEEEQ